METEMLCELVLYLTEKDYWYLQDVVKRDESSLNIKLLEDKFAICFCQEDYIKTNSLHAALTDLIDRIPCFNKLNELDMIKPPSIEVSVYNVNANSMLLIDETIQNMLDSIHAKIEINLF